MPSSAARLAVSSGTPAARLAFDHETAFTGNFADAVATDLAVVRAFGDALAGTGKTFIGIGNKPTGNAQRDAVVSANPAPRLPGRPAGSPAGACAPS